MGRNFFLGGIAIGLLVILLTGCNDTKSPVQTDPASQQQSTALSVDSPQAAPLNQQAR